MLGSFVIESVELSSMLFDSMLIISSELSSVNNPESSGVDMNSNLNVYFHQILSRGTFSQ